MCAYVSVMIDRESRQRVQNNIACLLILVPCTLPQVIVLYSIVILFLRCFAAHKMLHCSINIHTTLIMHMYVFTFNFNTHTLVELKA